LQLTRGPKARGLGERSSGGIHLASLRSSRAWTPQVLLSGQYPSYRPRETAKPAEVRFRALQNKDDTRQRPELDFILGKLPLALTETQSELS
jgi:hypothetical protein